MGSVKNDSLRFSFNLSHDRVFVRLRLSHYQRLGFPIDVIFSRRKSLSRIRNPTLFCDSGEDEVDGVVIDRVSSL
jgi:hypothetical protein